MQIEEFMTDARYTPSKVYNNFIERNNIPIKDGNIIKNIIVEKINSQFTNKFKLHTGSVIENLDENLVFISEKIYKLREQNFDAYYTDKDGTRVLIKYNKGEKKLDPIQIYEAEVQALRYLQGMLLIAKNINLSLYDKKEFLKEIVEIYNKYQDKNEKNTSAADSTFWLSDQFARSIKKYTGVKNTNIARKQLTMARDLGILLETHPAICTISEDDNKVTIEKSTPYKIRKNYYDNYFGNRKTLNDSYWFKNAKKLAGFDVDNKTTWLENFFIKNIENLKTLGVTAPPSARWLPLPANNQTIEISVAEKEKGSKELVFTTTDFMRNGIVIPYDFRKIPGYNNPHKEQKKIAANIIKDLLETELQKKINEYEIFYAGIIPLPPFYVNYQTLLSPLIGEVKFGHIDNNARFIKLVKEVINEINKNDNYNNGVEVILRHTNSAVNRNAKYSNDYKIDKITRVEKIQEFKKIAKNIKNTPNIKISKELQKELELRGKACFYLQDLIEKKYPYNRHDTYQRNIMQAALEHLCMGKQSLTIAGCKSARDRTAVFACAVKTMLEDEKAMCDWKTHDDGIVKSLKQGHHFRSMIYHSAIVKVALVHKNFMERLDHLTQKSIKTLLTFSKKPPAYPTGGNIFTKLFKKKG
jgi:hypothetical protein